MIPKILLVIVSLLLVNNIFAAPNYTFEYQVTGLQSGEFSGNSSNYSASYIFPYSPQQANGSNYSATVGIELLGLALPNTINNLICSIGNMTLSGLQTINNQYSTITTPFAMGLTVILGIIFILSGVILLWHYALKNMPGWPRIQLPRIRI